MKKGCPSGNPFFQVISLSLLGFFLILIPVLQDNISKNKLGA